MWCLQLACPGSTARPDNHMRMAARPTGFRVPTRACVECASLPPCASVSTLCSRLLRVTSSCSSAATAALGSVRTAWWTPATRSTGATRPPATARDMVPTVPAPLAAGSSWIWAISGGGGWGVGGTLRGCWREHWRRVSYFLCFQWLVALVVVVVVDTRRVVVAVGGVACGYGTMLAVVVGGGGRCGNGTVFVVLPPFHAPPPVMWASPSAPT
jgi:hypothetical protein